MMMALALAVGVAPMENPANRTTAPVVTEAIESKHNAPSVLMEFLPQGGNRLKVGDEATVKAGNRDD